MSIQFNEMDENMQAVTIVYGAIDQAYRQGSRNAIKGCVLGMIGSLAIGVTADIVADVVIPVIKEKIDKHKTKN